MKLIHASILELSSPPIFQFAKVDSPPCTFASFKPRRRACVHAHSSPHPHPYLRTIFNHSLTYGNPISLCKSTTELATQDIQFNYVIAIIVLSNNSPPVYNFLPG